MSELLLRLFLYQIKWNRILVRLWPGHPSPQFSAVGADRWLVSLFPGMRNDDIDESVDSVKRQYLQQIPIRNFQWPSSLAFHQESLWEEVFEAKVHRFPPGDRYQYLLLRDLVSRLGADDTDERILLRYVELLRNSPEVLSPTAGVVLTYSIPDMGDVCLVEQPSLLVGGGTTGLRTWEASFLLAEWMLAQGDLNGKRILELGAGTGLVGIIAAKMGAKVTMTDGSETVIERLQDNVERNGVIVETTALWWGDDDEILKREWDLIVGADITYDEEVCGSLAETYANLVKRDAIGILAATVRNEKTLETFKKESGKVFPALF